VFPYSKISAVCRGNNFEKVFFGDISKMAQFSKKAVGTKYGRPRYSPQTSQPQALQERQASFTG